MNFSLGQRLSLSGRLRLSDLFSVLDNSIFLGILSAKAFALALSASADSASVLSLDVGQFLIFSALSLYINIQLRPYSLHYSFSQYIEGDLKKRITAALKLRVG